MEVPIPLPNTQLLEISGKPPANQSYVTCTNYVLQIKEQFLVNELTYLIVHSQEPKFQKLDKVKLDDMLVRLDT